MDTAQSSQHKRSIKVKEFLEDFRSGASDDELMEKYQLSAAVLERFYGMLVERGILDSEETQSRLWDETPRLRKPNRTKRSLDSSVLPVWRFGTPYSRYVRTAGSRFENSRSTTIRITPRQRAGKRIPSRLNGRAPIMRGGRVTLLRRIVPIRLMRSTRQAL